MNAFRNESSTKMTMNAISQCWYNKKIIIIKKSTIHCVEKKTI